MSQEIPISDGKIGGGHIDNGCDNHCDNRRDYERLQLARRRDIDMLLIATVAVAFAFALQIRADQRVEIRWLPDFPVPELCAWRVWTGLDCPGCGLTRGFIRLAEGDCAAALALNRASLLFAVAVLVQFPYRLLMLCSSAWGRRLSESKWPNVFGWLLIAALTINWLLRLSGC